MIDPPLFPRLYWFTTKDHRLSHLREDVNRKKKLNTKNPAMTDSVLQATGKNRVKTTKTETGKGGDRRESAHATLT